ncbi:nitrilase-related carbon-nitrogen hydrolase [Nocardia tengchongensis]|uniref:nitrilase-related carbon-nitrogen hydrolase n=1 Tax=Nocardia tengchongensis TaxID=2055889 RepID=UPI003669E180
MNSAAGFGPESLEVIDYWDQLLTFVARMHQSWVVFVNRVGDEDGTRFWGGSRVIDPSGQVTAQHAIASSHSLQCALASSGFIRTEVLDYIDNPE